MRKNPLNKGIVMENAAGIGTVTSEMIEARAKELAAIDGRPSSQPSKADYQQAKRELTGETEMDPQEEGSESVLESDGWDPVPGRTGTITPARRRRWFPLRGLSTFTGWCRAVATAKNYSNHLVIERFPQRSRCVAVETNKIKPGTK